MALKVYVCVITHEYGTNVYVGSTEKIAIRYAAKFAREWWFSVFDPDKKDSFARGYEDFGTIPKKDTEVIEQYFDVEAQQVAYGTLETYEIVAVEVDA